jgi:hypothetical protein
MRGKSSICAIFYFFIIKKVKTLLRQEKNYPICMEKMYLLNANSKTALQNFDPEILMLKMHHALEDPVETDEDTIKVLIDGNRRITTREITERLNLSNSTVHHHFKRLGFISKARHTVWVPRVLTERNLCRRGDVCDLLLKRQENGPFLKRIITRDEKWVAYNNIKRKRSWNKKDEPVQSTLKVVHQKR